MKQVLKVATICKDKAFENGCIPPYNGVDTIYRDNHSDEDISDYDANVATTGMSGWKKQTSIIIVKLGYYKTVLLFYFLELPILIHSQLTLTGKRSK